MFKKSPGSPSAHALAPAGPPAAAGPHLRSSMLADPAGAAAWPAGGAAAVEPLAPLDPTGASAADDPIEACLAERVLLLGWRLRRLARFETDELDAAEPVTIEHGRHAAGGPPGASSPRSTSSSADAGRELQIVRLIEGLPQLGDDAPLAAADAVALLHAFLEVEPTIRDDQVRIREIPKDVELLDFDQWTAALVRRFLNHFAQLVGKSPRHIYDGALALRRYRLNQANDASPRATARRSRKEPLLPSPDVFDHFLRYEDHLRRQLVTAGRELRAYQSHRAGSS